MERGASAQTPSPKPVMREGCPGLVASRQDIIPASFKLAALAPSTLDSALSALNHLERLVDPKDLNGVRIYSTTTANLGTAAVSAVQIGNNTLSQPFDIVVDDVTAGPPA